MFHISGENDLTNTICDTAGFNALPNATCNFCENAFREPLMQPDAYCNGAVGQSVRLSRPGRYSETKPSRFKIT